jgi:hypothetical protein
MRFIIMHKTNAHWESGAMPGTELIARVGTLLGELSRAGKLQGAEGLRASMMDGPFVETKELLAGYVIVLAESMDDAGQWALKYIDVVEADEVDNARAGVIGRQFAVRNSRFAARDFTSRSQTTHRPTG